MEILLKYLSQLTILVSVIGYFGSRYFNSLAKRKEVKFTLFEARRAEATSEFLNAYFNIVEYFRSISNEEMINKSFTVTQMNDRWNPVRNALMNAFYKMSLYVEINDKSPFSEFELWCLILK
ncbi:hypothetical protein SAMN05192574_11054 [Mucilaginibacter gossypiicola]|uniref:Uncharacterized protein n=1 Tax=Mucilaginibacter gossypiicola TaxID=551995 RepID=A0A1H8RA78_9SPHI|nr:hypothetical protein [Mucilaginibacter gossypiicola]SEO63272.1 hypothetical protein SAMN05192574_11054 [Mucilaginibacter gossypiicola]